MHKALILTSVASMIEQFNMDNIKILHKIGYKVHVACNFNEGNTISDESVKSFIKHLKNNNIKIYNIPIPRKINRLSRIIISYNLINKINKENKYDIVHCHSPIGGVLARLVFFRSGKKETKVIYTAHGFHFFKGASIKNWIVFYPIEFFLSRITDLLITINREDYNIAKKFKMNKLAYIPGVGVDVSKFSKNKCKNKILKRKEFGLDINDKVLLSVGELNRNKNHEIIIHALGSFGRKNIIENRIYYFIAGKGDQKKALISLSQKYNISDRIIILGFRLDVDELYQMSDLFMFPSKREGLSISLIEAMSSGLPCIVSNIRGNRDLILDGLNGYLISGEDRDEYIKKIMFLIRDKDTYNKMAQLNKNMAFKYDKKVINKTMYRLYSNITL